jgi:hypothetical protein
MIYRRELQVGLLTALAAAALTLTGCSASATGSAVGATSHGAGTTRPASNLRPGGVDEQGLRFAATAPPGAQDSAPAHR